MVNFMDFNNKTLDELKTFHDKISKGTEFEIRFGDYNKDPNTHKKHFVSEFPVESFYKLKKTFKENFKYTEINTTEEIYHGGDLFKGVLKKIIDNSTGNVTFMLKSAFKTYDIYDYGIRLALSNEKDISIEEFKSYNINTPNFIRTKNRIVFELENGHLDLTIVKHQNEQRERYEVELEVDKKMLNKTLQYITVIMQIKQNNFFVISNKQRINMREQYRNMVHAPYFVGAQPETLQKNQIKQLYEQMYSVTDKADGDRAFMLIDNYRNVYFIDNNANRVLSTDVKNSQYHDCLIDGEIVIKEDKVIFLAFDLLFFNNNDIRGNDNYKLKDRLDRLNHIIKTTNSTQFYDIRMKKYYWKNVFLASEIILNETDQKDYKNDGLIFTPMNDPYPTSKRWTQLYKWKPAELNTVDFYSVYNENDNLWYLYVQHADQSNLYDNKTPNPIVLFDVEKLCGSEKSDEYTTYKTSLVNNAIDPTTNEPFRTNTVIEYCWDKITNQWNPIKTRWDKTTNPHKRGNYSQVACNNWNSIHDPIPKEFLFKFSVPSISDAFFFKHEKAS